MKEGIHLGRTRRRAVIGSAALLTAVAAALVLAALYYRARRDVVELEAEVAAARRSEVSSASSEGDGTRLAALRLRASLSVGAPGELPPSSVLRLVASTLPDEMTLVSLTLSSPPRRSLLIEAVANGAEAVTSLQENVARSPLVSGTRLLEERRATDGGLSVRFEVELVEPRTQ